MRSQRGQALIEFALVTPLLLIMLLGSIAVGLLVLNRMQIQHAANETAIAAAQHPSGCSVAGSRSAQILGTAPDSVTCSMTGQIVTVRLSSAFPQIAPFVPSQVVAIGRAMIREEPVEPTPTASPDGV